MDNMAVFSIKSYHLSNLISDIDAGNIALPDLQRPFVWDLKNVRNLMDSLYKGLPIGTVVLWEILESNDFKEIGYDKKRNPKYLVIDGQQRLTSLYSIIKNKNVMNNNFEAVKLNIAFNPIKEKFESKTAAIEKDAEWISDISEIFENEASYTFVSQYFKKRKTKLTYSDVNEDKIALNIEKVKNILKYQIPVLELESSLDPEDASEIFVRMNSQGKPINQSDFILTLMSVYWNEGRKELENFCISTRKIPRKNEKSAYNLIKVEPNPANLVRTIVAYSLLRGRLRYAYLALKGRNMDTKNISSSERSKNFEVFKDGQKEVLSLTNWHNFIKTIHTAGFIDINLISSKNTFYMAYALYLLGKNKFSVHYKELEKIIRKWFVFALITQRYTSSPESSMEKDLVLFRDNIEFVKTLKEIMRAELTEDFWKITLPQSILVTSGTRNHAYLIYQASMIYMDINVLFSDIKLKDHLNPLIKPLKKQIEIHHIFPRNYLQQAGIFDDKKINQVANLIPIEYKDNINIRDDPPSQYWHELYPNPDENDDILKEYDLPEDFWNMNYSEFLKERRVLMAERLKEYFEKLN